MSPADGPVTLAPLSLRLCAGLLAPLDAAFVAMANEPAALRDVAEFLRGYADAADQLAAELDAERRRTIAEHVAAKARRD